MYCYGCLVVLLNVIVFGLGCLDDCILFRGGYSEFGCVYTCLELLITCLEVFIECLYVLITSTLELFMA